MYSKLWLVSLLCTLMGVDAKTPNIISYNNVLFGAHTANLKHVPNHKNYRTFFVDLSRLLLDSMENRYEDQNYPFGQFSDESTSENVVAPSELCLNQTRLIFSEARVGAPWALSMIDSWAKPESDILGGQTNWVGSYYECIETTAYENDGNHTKEVKLFDGQYCTVVIDQQPGPVPPVTPGAIPTGIRIGLCVPSTCSEDDVTSIFSTFLKNGNASLYANGAVCQDKIPYDYKAITVLFVISLFLTAMLIGTVYDVIWVQRPKWTIAAAKRALDAESKNSTVNIKEYSQSVSVEETPLVPKLKPPSVETEGGVAQFLLAFSVYTNTSKIFSTSHVTGSITCIHGVRFISMTWVILGHTIAFGESASLNVVTYTQRSLKDWTFQAIANAPVAVDTFFTLSGLLVSYLTLKELNKRKGRINWFMFYFHRFWRLTPVYMLVIVVYVNLFRYWGDGPFWPQDGIEPDHCDNWWTNLLYINNLVRPKNMCMSWSWYLSNDMQFYVLSPLIIVPFFFSRIAGAISFLVFLLATLITTGVISKTNEFPPSLVGGDPLKMYDYFLDYYITPYCRMGPYIVGLLAGNLLYKRQCKLNIPRALNLLGWATATAVSLAVLYGLYDNANGKPLSVDVAAFYNAVHRTAWGMCVAWVVVACATGNGGFVNYLLSLPAIVPLSRLTYSCYLVHPVVMSVYYFGRERLFFLSTIDVIWAFFGNLVAAYTVALPVSLAFEAPMMGLERAFIRKPNS